MKPEKLCNMNKNGDVGWQIRIHTTVYDKNIADNCQNHPFYGWEIYIKM